MKKILTTILFILTLSSLKAQSKSTEIDWEARRADTANYWEKNVPDNWNYVVKILPSRDTVSCYFEFINNDSTIHGRIIETRWVYGYATRCHEEITGFMYDKKHKAPVKVLTYKFL